MPPEEESSSAQEADVTLSEPQSEPTETEAVQAEPSASVEAAEPTAPESSGCTQPCPHCGKAVTIRLTAEEVEAEPETTDDEADVNRTEGPVAPEEPLE